MFRWAIIFATIILARYVNSALADVLMVNFDGTTTPDDPMVGWVKGDPCEFPCEAFIENGHQVFYWSEPADRVGYYYRLTQLPTPPPPSLWVEWGYRSNHAIGPYFTSCDADFFIQYGHGGDIVNMYGDAVVSHEGSDYVLGLDENQFHTYRYENVDGINYWFSVDGTTFLTDSQNGPIRNTYLQFTNQGGCAGDSIPDLINEWDFVRFGTISYGEQIITSNPPADFVDARQHPKLDRLTITYDSPNYVYLDEISVEVTDGLSPIPVQTRRLDNGPSDVVEIVLDRPIPYNATTRFTFNDGTLAQLLEFTYAPGDTDGDGQATLSDLADFQNCFGSEPLTGVCPVLDFNQDDAVDLSDFTQFLLTLNP